MFEASSVATSSATGIRGNRLQATAIHCSVFPKVARVMWPKKTAAHWAVAAGVKERMASYWLSGAHPVSDSGKLAVINQLR